MFELYEHHNKLIWVNKNLKGKHREHCLCYSCEKFNPDNRDDNCKISNLLYAVDCAMSITTPVWECEQFIER